MTRYLKKQWRLSTLTCLFAIIAYGAAGSDPACFDEGFDAVVLLDLRGSILWTAVDLACWGFYLLLQPYKNIVRPKQFAL